MAKNKEKLLFDDEESEEENVSFQTRSEYAKRYDSWREKEEMHKLEQKYGENLNSDGSLESDSEDEEPEEMTPEQEEQFLKTLALLKTKDPRIYDPKYKFFEGEEETTEKVKQNVEEKSKPKKEVNSLAAAFADSDDDDDDTGGEIFKVEKRTPQQSKPIHKDEKLKAYLKGTVEAVDDPLAQELAPLKALWSDPQLDDGEKFLRDYILNDKHLEAGPESEHEKLLDSAALEADEELVEEQGRFERAYNFRFEEPDHEYLKRYPRTLNSIRPKNDARARKRTEVRTRKQQEKARRMEEIARLKAMKLKEIQEKIAKIKEVTGNDALGFEDEDIEGDFDPAEHDRRMKKIFDEQYYGDADDEKPVFPDLDEELEIENWESYEPQSAGSGAAAASGAGGDDDGAPHCEDADFNMDADYDPRESRATLLQEIQATLGNKRRNRKKKSKLAEVLLTTADKPKYVPSVTDKTYSEYMDEYYALECEDVIAGDLPTRFKYRQVVPNDFGLTVEEILLADDKELNSWASLKKTVKYRPDHVEKCEVKTYRDRAADHALRRRVLPSLYRDVPEEPEVVVPVEVKKKNKKKSKNKANSTQNGNSDETQPNAVDDTHKIQPTGVSSTENIPVKKKKTNDNKSSVQKDEINAIDNDIIDIDDDKKEHKAVPTPKDTANDSQLNTSAEGKKKRRKKKKKQNQVVGESQQNGGPKQNGDPSPNQNTEKVKKSNQQDNNNKNNLKRKLDTSAAEDNKSPAKKKKKNNKKNKASQGVASKNDTNNKFKHKNNKKAKGNVSDNPLSKLSNERLKAYGLNPKKYRSFLKYKKF